MKKAQGTSVTLLLSTTYIMVGSVLTGTLVAVLVASVAEVNERMKSSSIDTFLDLVGTIFFTVLNVIAAGAESVQSGVLFGLYAGIALSILFLVSKWLASRAVRHGGTHPTASLL